MVHKFCSFSFEGGNGELGCCHLSTELCWGGSGQGRVKPSGKFLSDCDFSLDCAFAWLAQIPDWFPELPPSYFSQSEVYLMLPWITRAWTFLFRYVVDMGCPLKWDFLSLGRQSLVCETCIKSQYVNLFSTSNSYNITIGLMPHSKKVISQSITIILLFGW